MPRITALEEYTGQIYDNLSAEVQNDIALCRHSLVYGPAYVDEDGELCDCFDEGAKAHDFSAAVDRIRDALDFVGTIWIDHEADDVLTSEPEGWEDEDGEWQEPDWSQIYRYDRRDLIRQIVGAALAEYVA